MRKRLKRAIVHAVGLRLLTSAPIEGRLHHDAQNTDTFPVSQLYQTKTNEHINGNKS